LIMPSFLPFLYLPPFMSFTFLHLPSSLPSFLLSFLSSLILSSFLPSLPSFLFFLILPFLHLSSFLPFLSPSVLPSLLPSVSRTLDFSFSDYIVYQLVQSDPAIFEGISILNSFLLH
jgi:hypothetical protein